jgi:hypothetical protein
MVIDKAICPECGKAIVITLNRRLAPHNLVFKLDANLEARVGRGIVKCPGGGRVI